MRTALLLLLLLVAPGLALAQAGRFLLVSGEAALVRGAQEIAAAVGTPVHVGDTIRVGARSNVQIRMTDESIIALRSNSVFRVDEYIYSEKAEESRSVFSLLKGGLRTVSGAIGRRPAEGLVRTASPADAKPDPSSAEKAEPAEESKLFGLIKAPLRTVAGALTPTRHAVRLPTATIGIRGSSGDTIDNSTGTCEGVTPGCEKLPAGVYHTTYTGSYIMQNDGGTQIIGEGQFGFARDPKSPPVILPGDPGLNVSQLPFALGVGGGRIQGPGQECVVR